MDKPSFTGRSSVLTSKAHARRLAALLASNKLKTYGQSPIANALENQPLSAGCPDFLRVVKPAMRKAALRRKTALHPYGSRGTIKTLEHLRVNLLIAEFIGELL